jgi:hypothetical protein
MQLLLRKPQEDYKPVRANDFTYHKALMSLEKSKSLIGFGVPNSETVILAGGKHQTSVFISLTMSNSAPVALELALAFKVPRIKLCGRVKFKNLNLSGLRTKHKDVGAESMVSNFAHTEDRVRFNIF